MGLQYNFENIRNVRSGKGVYSGCEVSRSAANELTVTAGRVKFGLTPANVTALTGQELNEGGTETATAQAVLNVAALPDGNYTLYMKTDASLATDPPFDINDPFDPFLKDADTLLLAGPLVTLNNVGTTGVNARNLGTPSVALCRFTITADDVVASSISYNVRETLM